MNDDVMEQLKRRTPMATELKRVITKRVITIGRPGLEVVADFHAVRAPSVSLGGFPGFPHSMGDFFAFEVSEKNLPRSWCRIVRFYTLLPELCTARVSREISRSSLTLVRTNSNVGGT